MRGPDGLCMASIGNNTHHLALLVSKDTNNCLGVKMIYFRRQEYCLNYNQNHAFISRRKLTHTQKLNVAGEVRDVTFSVTNDGDKLRSARDLINERYGWKGYGRTHSIPSDEHHTTFTAEMDDVVIGTMTLAIDSDLGLSLDRTFADEADKVRNLDGSHICELTKLAFDSCIRSKEVLAGLFHLAFIYGAGVSDCTDLFIEVNPRHARFYQTMLGFKRIGEIRTNSSVDAPAQLMRLAVDTIRHNICERAGAADAIHNHSLYPYFFSQSQEFEIQRSLALDADGLRRQPGQSSGKGEFAPPAGERHGPFNTTLCSVASLPATARTIDAKMKEHVRRAA